MEKEITDKILYVFLLTPTEGYVVHCGAHFDVVSVCFVPSRTSTSVDM